jgi:hypothetical protein
MAVFVQCVINGFLQWLEILGNANIVPRVTGRNDPTNGRAKMLLWLDETAQLGVTLNARDSTHVIGNTDVFLALASVP